MNAHSVIVDDIPEIISITVPGAPVGKGRPRFTQARGFVQTFTPAKTRKYEDLIRCEAANVMCGRAPTQEPVSVTVYAYVPIPKSFSKKRHLDALSGALKPITRPDLDNYAKMLDGLNAIVWRDDSQITDLIVRKRYSDRPRLVITVEVGEDFA